LTVGQFLLSIFFIFDSLEKLRDTSKMAELVSHALIARETTLSNAGLPLKFHLDVTTIFWVLRVSALV
jgi:hypothetical protein